MKKHISIFLALVLILSTVSCSTIDAGGLSTDDFKQAYEKALDNFAAEDYDASISFKSMELETASHVGKLVRVTGKIAEIVKTSDGKADVYHLTVNNDSDKKVWAQTSASGKSVVETVAVGDTILLYGILYGTNLFTPIIYVVKIEKTDEIKGTRTNPYKLGETAAYNGMDSYSSYRYIAEITPNEVIRGDEASSMFSNDPDEGKEFFLVKFKIKVLESMDDGKVSLNSSSFEIVNKNGVEYSDRVYATGIKEFDDLYAGGETEGYFCYIIDAGDEPSVLFYDIWFTFTA